MLQAVGTWELVGSSYRLGHSTHAALMAGSVTLRKQEEKTRLEGDVSAVARVGLWTVGGAIQEEEGSGREGGVCEWRDCS